HAQHNGSRDRHCREGERAGPAANAETFERDIFNCPSDQRAADEGIRTDRKPEQLRSIFGANADCRGKNNAGEYDSSDALPEPERMVGHGLCAGELRRAGGGIEKPPMAPTRSCTSTLPGLID